MKLNFEEEQESHEQEQESHDQIKIPHTDLFYNEQIKLEEIYNLKVSIKFIKILSTISIVFCFIFTIFQIFQDSQFSTLQKHFNDLKKEIEELKYSQINIDNKYNHINDIPPETNNDEIIKQNNDDTNNENNSINKVEFTAETRDLKKKFYKEIVFLKECMTETKIKKFEKCETPKISIVIPFYETERYITRLLQSIQKQKIEEIEIIFVENSLGKKGLPKLAEYSKIDQRIKIVKNEKNQGLLNSYLKGISNVKSNFMIFLEEEGMLLPYLKDIFDSIITFNRDINDFSSLKGTINGITFDDKIKDGERSQPEISESYYNENFVNDNPLLNKIFKTQVIKAAMENINEYYLTRNFDFHVDSLLYICICSYVKSYKAYENLYSEYHLKKEFSRTNENVEKLFNSTIYLSQFIYDLDYEFEEILNQRCQLVINLFNWPLNYNYKMNIDIGKANKVVNMFINNKDINDENKRKLNAIIRKIKDRAINKN